MKKDHMSRAAARAQSAAAMFCSCTAAKAGSVPQLSSTCGAAIFSELAWGKIAESLDLSGRELQVVRGVFDDAKESAIAATLGISPHTVHTHLERLHHKLRVVDRVGLVLRIISEFLSLTESPEGGLPAICARRAAGNCPLD